ncbi:hypothetical protein AVEN_139561-1 [Araneus ventricosus]|uniref:Uncharacterized protein n=1 Tax=Araneus ventricosus TaxID=182803 RepID=A0A4Y2TVF9_ARAVE|nr:hypothetical protein AVEN_139561-1 [Araneus ventricosus]
MTRGLLSASVVSHVVAVNITHIKGGRSGQTASLHPFTRALQRDLPSHAPSEWRDFSSLVPPACGLAELRVARGSHLWTLIGGIRTDAPVLRLVTWQISPQRPSERMNWGRLAL